MTQITGGELLARALANEGVKFVFGLQAPESDPFLAALEGNGIEFITVRHEAAAVHMAEGAYKTTGQGVIDYSSASFVYIDGSLMGFG